MKILIVSNDLRVLRLHRGALISAIKERGDDLTIISNDDDRKVFPEYADLKLVKVSIINHRFALLSDLRLLFSILGHTFRHCPDVVHSFTIKPNLFSALALGLVALVRSRPPKLVSTFPGLGKIYEPAQRRGAVLRRRLVNFALRHSLRRLNHTATFENARDQSHMIEQGIFIREDTKVIMGAGIDLSMFRPADRRAIEEPITFLLASRLIKAKGIAQYIEAAKRISKSGSAGKFLLAGQVDKSDPDAFDVAHEERTNNLGPVEYIGSVVANEMPALLQKVDVVCLPTMLNEGFPRVLLEGAACGCAAIASDQASIRQLVVPEQTGWLIEAGNPNSLYEAMQEALSSRDQTRALGINARHLIEKLPVSDAAVVSSFLELYGENTI